MSSSNEALSLELAAIRQSESSAKEEVVRLTTLVNTPPSPRPQQQIDAHQTPKTSNKYSEGTAFSPSWTPSTIRSNFESAAISNEILRDNQEALEKAVEEKDGQISEVTSHKNYSSCLTRPNKQTNKQTNKQYYS
jgi:hypothetical protein